VGLAEGGKKVEEIEWMWVGIAVLARSVVCMHGDLCRCCVCVAGRHAGN
jgi:choline kinase